MPPQHCSIYKNGCSLAVASHQKTNFSRAVDETCSRLGRKFEQLPSERLTKVPGDSHQTYFYKFSNYLYALLCDDRHNFDPFALSAMQSIVTLWERNGENLSQKDLRKKLKELAQMSRKNEETSYDAEIIQNAMALGEKFFDANQVDTTKIGQVVANPTERNPQSMSARLYPIRGVSSAPIGMDHSSNGDTTITFDTPHKSLLHRDDSPFRRHSPNNFPIGLYLCCLGSAFFLIIFMFLAFIFVFFFKFRHGGSPGAANRGESSLLHITSNSLLADESIAPGSQRSDAPNSSPFTDDDISLLNVQHVDDSFDLLEDAQVLYSTELDNST
uniref:Uncharacterized protein n=1 Tax=Percolomonas cosmopolitus TaxID=63605 RepID=A0A7S1PGE0_9EUKA|mmetsp:Transcript_5719/g.21649  ORF Transcript_5719/g.21649 Transcript_5719/m.21649 type:complete len:329 (+) Transcript_5719:1620-2606(+)